LDIFVYLQSGSKVCFEILIENERVPWIQITFDIYWWVINLPFFAGLLIPFVIFGIKAAIEIKNLIKHRRDANGDSIFKAAHYTGLIVFSLFLFF
jgi:hypothetical protein